MGQVADDLKEHSDKITRRRQRSVQIVKGWSDGTAKKKGRQKLEFWEQWEDSWRPCRKQVHGKLHTTRLHVSTLCVAFPKPPL